MKYAKVMAAFFTAFLVGCHYIGFASAQDHGPLVISLKTLNDVNNYIAAASPDYYAKKEEERRKKFPVVIVIPGIMGSALVDQETKAVIWGEKTLRKNYDPSSIMYPSKKPITPEVLASYDVLGKSTDVYGDALKNLSKALISDKSFINVFPYDWREDNRISARKFNYWICQNKSVFSDRNVIIASHSMGGLITKYWIKEYYSREQNNCQDGSPAPKFARLRVNFIGVPHYGAPKALKVFSNGFYLARSGDAASIFGAWLDQLDREWLSKAINDYGFSFPSAYQLLPIYNAECFPKASRESAKSALPPPFIRTTSDGGTTAHEDIFSPDLWEAMEWPKTGRTNLPADYYSNILPEYLRSAYNFLCELANFELPETVEVSYYASNSFQTDVSYTFDSESLKSIPSTETIPGDETVPYIVAGNFLLGNQHRVLPVDGDLRHSVMLRSKLFWRQIEDELYWAETRSQKAAISTLGDYNVLKAAYVQTQTLPAAPLAGGDIEEKNFTIKLASDVITELQISPIEAFKHAKESKNPYLKNVLYKSVADLTSEENPRLSVTAANSLTHVLIENYYFAEASSNSEAIKASAAWEKLSRTADSEIKGYVLNNDGWAKFKTGKVDDARMSFEEAISYGSKNAVNGLNQVEMYQGPVK